VYLPYAYTVEDHVKMTLPAGMTVDFLPKDAQMSFATNATYGATYRGGGAAYEYDRQEQVSRILYKVDIYPDLRDFFQKVSAQDQAQVVLRITPAPAAAGR
jgi:hypothetical protein